MLIIGDIIDTPVFLLLVALITGLMILFKLIAKCTFSSIFKRFSDNQPFHQFWWLLFSYGVIVAIYCLSGSAIFSLFSATSAEMAEEMREMTKGAPTHLVAPTAFQIRNYIVSSSVVGIMVACLARILGFYKKSAIIDALYYQFLYTIGAFLLFSIGPLELSKRKIFEPTFAAFPDLWREWYIVALIGLLVIMAFFTEGILLMKNRNRA